MINKKLYVLLVYCCYHRLTTYKTTNTNVSKPPRRVRPNLFCDAQRLQLRVQLGQQFLGATLHGAQLSLLRADLLAARRHLLKRMQEIG
jgi:hypothetical protein